MGNIYHSKGDKVYKAVLPESVSDMVSDQGTKMLSYMPYITDGMQSIQKHVTHVLNLKDIY